MKLTIDPFGAHTDNESIISYVIPMNHAHIIISLAVIMTSTNIVKVQNVIDSRN